MKRSVSVILVLALLGLGAWIMQKRVPAKSNPSVNLSDGTILQVEAVTVGTNHVFQKEPISIHRLRAYLPGFMQWILGRPGYVEEFTEPKDCAHLWLSRWDPAQEQYLDVDVTHLEVLDEDGQAFYVGSSSSGGNGVFKERHLRLDCFPRRAAQFRIRFNTQGADYGLAIPNPLHGTTFPSWDPSSLPQVRTAHGFQFELKSLAVRSRQEARYRVEPVFQVYRQGEDRTDWWDPRMEFVDATGNRRQDALSLREPAWKLDTHFFPSVRYPFEPAQVYRLGEVRLPNPGEFHIFELSETLRKGGLVFAALTGPGRYTIVNGRFESAEPWDEGMNSGYYSSGLGSEQWNRTFTDERLNLILLLIGPSEGTELLASFQEEDRRLLARMSQGADRIWEAVSSGASQSNDGQTLRRLYNYTVEPTEEGEGPLRFELIPAYSVHLEFVVAPPER